MKTALVLSAGGMYGAYQAGVWKALRPHFSPDLVVGASIGALNGWAIAGGCDPDDLIRRWLALEQAQRYRWRAPRSLTSGFLDCAPLRAVIEELHRSYRPQSEIAVVATDLLRLEPCIFISDEITAAHLAASTAIVGLFEQIRIGGRIYSDGGLLSALPVWAAVRLGARRIIAVNVLPEAPGAIARTFVSAVKMLSRFRAGYPAESIEMLEIGPKRLLGRPAECLYWKRDRIERWIKRGEDDAKVALAAGNHFFQACFERK